MQSKEENFIFLCLFQKSQFLPLSTRTIWFCPVFRWTELWPLNEGRAILALEWVPDGRLFAVGGVDDNFRPLATVEMLECPWVTEGPVHTKWHYVSPMQRARCAHAVVFFTGKIIAAGGHEEGSVECFTLPTSELPQGQWVNIRPMSCVNTLWAILPFGEDLLFVGKHEIVCFIGVIFMVVISHHPLVTL